MQRFQPLSLLLAAGVAIHAVSASNPQLIRRVGKSARIIASDGAVADANPTSRRAHNIAAHNGEVAAGAGALLQNLGQEHVLNVVSARWTDNIVYAVFTSSIEKHHKNLVSQLKTWAAGPHDEGRFVAMGAKDYPKDWQEKGTILSSDCADTRDALACKEAWLLAEGAARDVAWLVIIGEDNWVNPKRLEAELWKRSREPRLLPVGRYTSWILWRLRLRPQPCSHQEAHGPRCREPEERVQGAQLSQRYADQLLSAQQGGEARHS